VVDWTGGGVPGQYVGPAYHGGELPQQDIRDAGGTRCGHTATLPAAVGR